MADARPLVVHVVYRFDTGGLENGVVNLINHLPADAWRHAVVALTEVVPAFAARVLRDDVEFVALHKPPGHGFGLYPKLVRLLRQWRPAIVHTRNLAALEFQLPAWLARVPVRIHGEHGRDTDDLDGLSVRHQRIRRLYRPFVHHHVALSRELAEYLRQRIGVRPQRLTEICNGVDTGRFHPPASGREPIAGCPFTDTALFVVGTVGRMQAVKAQTVLAHAFVRALQLQPALRERLRLVMVGDGPLRAQCQAIVEAAGVAALAWLPGPRDDIAQVLRGLDGFVLPSLAEGISNTILEAMASGLPVLATDVGGNADLVVAGETGAIVPADDPDALAIGLIDMAGAPDRAAAMGRAGRARALARFSLPAMVDAYRTLYRHAIAAASDAGGARAAEPSEPDQT